MKIHRLDDISTWVQGWMDRTWVHKIIAISGGSSTEKVEHIPPGIVSQYNESVAAYVRAIIDGACRHLQDYRVAILTGGTKGWVPEDALKVARQYGIPTVWVYPARGAKSALGDALVDCQIEVASVFWESCWWDESPIFSKLADASVILGGGAGTLIEVAHALKINESLIDKGKPPKYIVPVSGIPGMSWLIQLLPWKSQVKKATFPEWEIKSGQEVAAFLKQKLHLADVHKLNDRK